MATSELVFGGAFALVLLLSMDHGMWWNARLYLSIDYEEKFKLSTVPRYFPNRKRFQIAKAILGVCFIALFAVTMHLGGSQHLTLAVTSLAVLVLFCVVSGWESAKSFRYFAERNLTPRPKGGYLGR